jgi:CRISPR-associated Csx14 family protein
MEIILIATLGDHPAVVPGMVKALNREGIKIDTLHLVHTEDTGKYIGTAGVRLIQAQMEGRCEVCPVSLGFDDPNTRERSLDVMSTVNGLLKQYQDPAEYCVYLSLSGGRKNMAALTALVGQFYPAVQGLYHLLDRREGTGETTFPSAKEMATTMSEAQVREAMDPPLEALKLVRVPYPAAFVEQAESLQAFLETPDEDAVAPVPLSPDAVVFYRNVFNPDAPQRELAVWLTEGAADRFREWAAQGHPYADAALACLQEMRDPVRVQEWAESIGAQELDEDTARYFYVYTRPDTPVHPVYYTERQPLDVDAEEPVERVVVCGLALAQEDKQYEPALDVWLQTTKHRPARRLAALVNKERVLVVPLGKSPMIATQTYTLLRKDPDEGSPEVPVVALVYPRQSGPIRDGVRVLKTLFAERGVTVKDYAIRRLRDIDTTDKCTTYLRELGDAIVDLQQAYPDHEIALSLSGGRKGMSVLSLFAAQRAGVSHLYHTLIQGLDMEARIERETDIEAIQDLRTDEQRAHRLFLDAYGADNFTLFRVPVIPVTGPEDA